MIAVPDETMISSILKDKVSTYVYACAALTVTDGPVAVSFWGHWNNRQKVKVAALQVLSKGWFLPC